MAEQYTPNLGGTPDQFTARRDCVHVAVAPVVAGIEMDPGQGVTKGGDGLFYSFPLDHDGCLGVVDPFRTEPVKRGERFWLLLKPGTITGLRHMWSHEAFVAQPKESP
jgi:hypothetical protein